MSVGVCSIQYVLNSMFRLGLVDNLVTHGNTKGFGLIPLSGARCDYMSPLLKTKTNIELDNHKGFEDFL